MCMSYRGRKASDNLFRKTMKLTIIISVKKVKLKIMFLVKLTAKLQTTMECLAPAGPEIQYNMSQKQKIHTTPHNMLPGSILRICLRMYFLVLAYIVFSALGLELVIISGPTGTKNRLLVQLPKLKVMFVVKLETVEVIISFTLSLLGLKGPWGPTGPLWAPIGARAQWAMGSGPWPTWSQCGPGHRRGTFELRKVH